MRMGALLTVLMFFLIIISTCVLADKLEIDSLEVDGKRFSGSGTVYVEPGKEINFEVVVENLWDKDDNDALHINDIRVHAILYDVDSDLVYTSSRFDLRPEGYKTVRFDLDVPSNVDSDRNYNLVVEVFGIDETGEDLFDEIELDVEVDREEHDVTVDVDVSSPPPCTDTAKVRIKLENEGIYDEEIDVVIWSAFLGEIYSRKVEIEAGEDESLSRSFDVSSLGEGRHTIDIIVELDNDIVRESGYVRIMQCDDENFGITSKTTKIIRGDEGTRSPNRYYFHTIDAPQKVEVQFEQMNVPNYMDDKSNWGMVVLILANMVLAIIVIVGIVLLVMKTKLI